MVHCTMDLIPRVEFIIALCLSITHAIYLALIVYLGRRYFTLLLGHVVAVLVYLVVIKARTYLPLLELTNDTSLVITKTYMARMNCLVFSCLAGCPVHQDHRC